MFCARTESVESAKLDGDLLLRGEWMGSVVALSNKLRRKIAQIQRCSQAASGGVKVRETYSRSTHAIRITTLPTVPPASRAV